MMSFLNYELMHQFDTKTFRQQQPFPHTLFKDLLRPKAFDLLYREFPSLDLFERHVNVARNATGQRPHNRYYLALQQSIYHDKQAGSRGVATLAQLPASWQAFVTELKTSTAYHDFLARMLGIEDFDARYAWHVGENSSEVSPHCDSLEKLATHIFYFNTSADWDLSWGGSIIVLDGKQVPQDNPEISDFRHAEAFDIRDNRSFLFQNTARAWHAVEALTSPAGHYRRLFNVIIQVPKGKKLRHFDPSHWQNRLRRGLMLGGIRGRSGR